MSELPPPSFADVVRSPRHSHPISPNSHRPSSSATSLMDHHSGEANPPSPTVVQSVGSDSYSAPPSSPQSRDTTDPDWISVRPQRRQRSRLPHRLPRNLPYKYLPALKPVPSLICTETIPPDSPPNAPIQPPSPTVTTANAFATLAEFQISCDEGFQLHPPRADPPPAGAEDSLLALPEDDIDDAFLQALGVIHHNPQLSFDAEMTEFLSPATATPGSPKDTTKRRKRDDVASPILSP
ncbi:hypothetical protein BVRB_6g148910 [Beta vulgaris subsp. vulgaris]|nr:hypothetical protein BVRB_6g148910 [Beta vulgaris subsp. vulgaris]